MLARRAVEAPVQSVTLGPSLGQCCGGALELSYELVGAADAEALRERLGAARHAVALFGGGHVGRARVRALAPLPFAITWIDSRDEVFPDPLPDGVVAEHSEPVQGAVPELASGSLVLIMSFSHAEDRTTPWAGSRAATLRAFCGRSGAGATTHCVSRPSVGSERPRW
jgi:xanthine dehydrogenase accessory factor